MKLEAYVTHQVIPSLLRWLRLSCKHGLRLSALAPAATNFWPLNVDVIVPLKFRVGPL